MNARAHRFVVRGAWLLAMVLASSWVFAADTPPPATGTPVHLGDSLEVVKQKLGEPRSELEAGSRDVLIYPQGQIVLENGRVTDIPGGVTTAPAVSTTPPPKPAPASATSSFATAKPDPEGSHPTDVTLVEQKDANGVVTILAHSDTNTDFTITFNANLTNMTPSHPLPYTADSGGQQNFVLIQLSRDDPRKPWNYSTHFDYHVGGRRDAKTNDAVYLLPYQSGETHRVGQGNFGKFSHFEGSQNEYATDFTCDPGTIVCAARAGVVTGFRQDFTTGGTDPKFKSQANYIIIRHDDGTYAEYYHLQHNGVFVKLGQRVAAGEHIGLSGATGYVSGPHIHFAVFQNIDGKTRVTLPVKFQTSSGVLAALKEGQSY